MQYCKSKGPSCDQIDNCSNAACSTVLFLFYFNRLFADLVTYGLRVYIWHYYRVDVKLQALQVSLLAGRVFFKSIRYHGQNETILVHDGHITWRYWLRHVQELECQKSQPVGDLTSPTDASTDRDATKDTGKGVGAGRESVFRRLPCRVLLKARGVEWFIYNRSPAYDAIFRSMGDGDAFEHAQQKATDNDSTKSKLRSSDDTGEKLQWCSRDEHEERLGKDDELVNDEKPSSISTGSSASHPAQVSTPLPGFLNLLPIGVECSKGAIVMGNRNTRSILTAKFDSAAGTINAKECRPVDRYKQTFDFDFVHPVIGFKHNREYTESQLKEGANLHTEDSLRPIKKARFFKNLTYRSRVRHTLTSLRDFVPYRRGSVESFNHPHSKSAAARTVPDENTGAYGQHRWLGLTRYLNDDDDLLEQERWKTVEYAQFPTVVDSPKISMSFYWDVPGLVPESTVDRRVPLPYSTTNVNGDAPPDWGMDLKVCGGTIYYGPWADRQRSDLQTVFFPTLYKDAVAASRLAPGQTRISTALNILIELEEQTTLRVPFREESKDWRWRGQSASSAVMNANEKKPRHHLKGGKRKKPGQSPEERAAGWLDIKALPDSTIRFSMDLVAKNDGYQNRIDLDIKGLEISSSVNHALLWRSKWQTISCDLSNPLAWNQLRQWRVEIHDSGMEMFILRDHMFLLTDLISDWTSGPLGDFHSFVPFEYSISLKFSNFRVYLNANDSNIVNSPSDLEDNTFVILEGAHLDADLVIPIQTFRPTRNAVSFAIVAFNGRLHLHTPPRNTQHTFLKTVEVASLKDLRIKGSYNFLTTTSPNFTDILFMDLHGTSPRIHAHGFLIRYLMKIKDNYFGDDIHFRTLEEYQAQMAKKLEHPPEDTVVPQSNRISNDLDVILGITADNLSVLLPAHLYSSENNIRLEILSVTSDLRITNYYMDLALYSTPIAISNTSHTEEHQQDLQTYSSTQVFVDGLQVFGHRLFGLPPIEPTYVCNWDFDVGSITGECSIEFFKCLTSALECFDFTFDDAENALPPLHPDIVHDVTFFRARLQSVSIALRMEQAAFLLMTGKISFNFNDWADALFSDRLQLLIPHLTLAIADSSAAATGRVNLQGTSATHACLQTAIEMNGIHRKGDFKVDRNLQQSHIALHDMRTRRVSWLIHEEGHEGAITGSSRLNKTRPPAMPYPPMPEPVLTKDYSTLGDTKSSSTSVESQTSRAASTRKSSFFVNVDANCSTRKRSISRKKAKSRERKRKSSHILGTQEDEIPKIPTNRTSTSPATDDTPDDEGSREGISESESFAHSNLSFSSPYKRPYFPLLATKVNMADLPGLPMGLANSFPPNDTSALENVKTQVLNGDREQSNFILNMSPGVQVFCTATALFLMSDMIAEFSANDAATLLDHLQIDAMTDILSVEKKRKKNDGTTNFRIFVPWVAVRFLDKAEYAPRGTARQDRYDLMLDNLTFTAANASQLSTDTVPTQAPRVSVHLVLNQLTCSAREILENKAKDQVVITLSVNEPVFWMLYGATATAELQFEKLDVVSESSRVDYISQLLRQGLTLSDELAARFQNIEKERKSCTRILVMLLSTEGNHVPDPPFLTRASYALRSASHHIRTNDSWKVMSRLRYVYHCLTEPSRDSIDAQCTQRSPSCPRDASQRVVSGFRHWQTVDVARIESCELMQKVYKELRKQPEPESAIPIPLKASVRSGLIQILVEPGLRQNEVCIQGLAIGAVVNQRLFSDHMSTQKRPNMIGSTVQIHCVEIAIRLNWSILGLLESIIEIVGTTTHLSSGTSASSIRTSLPLRRRLHVVVSSEMGILNCETPNIKMVSLCQGLKTSVVMSEGSTHLPDPSITIALNCDATTSEIKSHSTLLTLYKLRQPRIFGTRLGDPGNDSEAEWRFVGTGQDVSFQVFANPLQLIEAADCFLDYELAHLVEWTKSLRPRRELPVKTSKSSGLSRVQVALFLEQYLVSIGILPSLKYQISGTSARSFIKTGQHGKYDVAIDFDLNDHAHVLDGNRKTDEVQSVLSILRMPPINGQISLDLTPNHKSIEFSALVESIVFDASAVHAIFAAFNRPEILRLASSINDEIQVFEGHYRTVFDTNNTNRNSNSSERLFYRGTVTLESLALHARTSDSLSVAHGAELQLKLNRLHLEAANRDPESMTVLTFPRLELQLKGINLTILRFDGLDLQPCGNVAIQAMLRSTSKLDDTGRPMRSHQIRSSSLQINIYSDTAPVIVAILVYLQETLKDIDFSREVQNLKKLGRARLRSEAPLMQAVQHQSERDEKPAALFKAMYSLEMTDICVTWRIEESVPTSPDREPENLILSVTKIDLATKKENAARLLIENLQLQMVPASKTTTVRSLNSALMPEVLFNVAYVSTAQDRRLAFQVAGKSLDVRLTSQFILPVSELRRSMALSIERVRTATADWTTSASVNDGQTKRLIGNKKLASLLVDADFAGAVVYVQGRRVADPKLVAFNALRGGRLPQHGRYNQFTPDDGNNSSTTLRAPGIAFKVEYKNTSSRGQSLNAEMKVDASSNTLYPTVVPLVMEISSSVKAIVAEPNEETKAAKSSLPQPKFLEDERLRGGDPAAIFGNCRLNLGLRICRQEFSLSCQPIARVAATARFDDIYVAVNTIQSQEHGKFFTFSGAITHLQASVQHVYSRESTGSFEIDSMVISLMNSKHVSAANGISAILNISPMKAQINGKQAQDFLLFREIWVPPEIRRSPQKIVPVPATESQAFIVQRYQQMAATSAFPWNATISIAELDIQVDLGQSVGKSAFVIQKFWVSSKKSSDWEQNLCLGFDRMAIDSTGRMSGFVELQDLKVRTSIQWPVKRQLQKQTPLVQASLAFSQLRVKAAFDYQAFAAADITTFEFLMYNVRDARKAGRDRLVGVLDGDKLQIFCTTTSASQAIALQQAFERLYQEKVAAYQASLRDIEKFLRRKSSINSSAVPVNVKQQENIDIEDIRSSLKLQTDVVVNLKAVNLGAFPNTFFDNQVFKLEALDASARFAVFLEEGKIHSTLGMTLGQLRIALAGITRASVPKSLGEVSVADVVSSATGSRGGTILKVPKLVASMETWQIPDSTNIDYIFKSSFQGRVDVGWNYSRISYIRGMWVSHARSLANRLGKPLPQSAVQITGGPRPEGDEGSQTYVEGEEGKITAVVNVPQSKYQYTALEPPVIETPQLRDMGEATPPLEWIGLHRDRLPNLTHQIVIVTLLEVAKEVDDAYSKILGTS